VPPYTEKQTGRHYNSASRGNKRDYRCKKSREKPKEPAVKLSNISARPITIGLGDTM